MKTNLLLALLASGCGYSDKPLIGPFGLAGACAAGAMYCDPSSGNVYACVKHEWHRLVECDPGGCTTYVDGGWVVCEQTEFHSGGPLQEEGQ